MEMPTAEEMRVRFADLQARRASILAASMPLRQSRDDLVNAAREQEALLNAEIREAEEGLFDIDQESAMIARALGGKTGTPAED